MNNKKVLILVNHELVIYNFRKELVEKLLELGYEVIISSPKGPKIDELIAMGTSFIETNIDRRGKNIFKDLKLIRHYKKMIKKVKPNVVLTYTIKPNIYGGIAAVKYKVPYIANITGLGSALENKSMVQKLLVFLYKRAFRSINTVFFQNEENMQFFIDRKIAMGKHELLPGSGVNLEHFKVTPYPEKEKIRFIFVSRIMKEKGIDYYLNAANHFMDKYDNLEFHICGSLEEDYKEIISKYEKENKIIYHGMVRDVREYLKNVHAIIHPTYYPEGMSNVLLEAAASGRPIITTNRSGCREIVDNGVNGYLVDVKDLSQLTKTIEKFIALTNEKKKDMGIAGRKKIEKEFDRQIVVDAYMKEIENILNERDKDIKWKLQ